MYCPGRGNLRATVRAGGDSPFVRRMVGLTTHYMCGGWYTEATWDTQSKSWVNTHIELGPERHKSLLADFLAGMPPIQAAGVVGEPLLDLPPLHFFMCILHLCMSMGRFLWAFVKTQAAALPPGLESDLQAILVSRRTG